MKINMAILKLEPWNLKTDDGRELSGFSAIWENEDFEQFRSTFKGEMLENVQKIKLPALFEADVKGVQKYNNGKAKFKYEVNSVKFLRELTIFIKA